MKIKLIILGAMVMAGLASCDDAKYKYTDVTGEGRLFINEAVGLAKSRSLIIPDEGQTVNITPRFSKPMEEDIEVTLYLDEAALDEFNAKNSTSYVLLPAANYELETKTVIRAGKVVGDPIPVRLKALTYEQNNSGSIFALPLSIKTENENVKLLESSNKFLLAAQPVMRLNVPELTQNCIIRIPLKEDYLLPSWTFELLFNASDLPSGNGRSWIASAIGFYEQGKTKIIQDGFMWRLGDPGGSTPANLINGMISRSGKLTSSIALKPTVWYHIAVVCDNGPITLYINGEIAYTGASGYTATQFFALEGIRLAGEDRTASNLPYYYRFSNVKFWETARTLDQLNNNRYSVPLDSPGLLGYWKLDDAREGQASVPTSDSTGLLDGASMKTIDTYLFKDATGKQPDAIVDKSSSETPFKYALERRVEVGYDWDGKLP